MSYPFNDSGLLTSTILCTGTAFLRFYTIRRYPRKFLRGWCRSRNAVSFRQMLLHSLSSARCGDFTHGTNQTRGSIIVITGVEIIVFFVHFLHSLKIFLCFTWNILAICPLPISTLCGLDTQDAYFAARIQVYARIQFSKYTLRPRRRFRTCAASVPLSCSA